MPEDKYDWWIWFGNYLIGNKPEPKAAPQPVIEASDEQVEQGLASAGLLGCVITLATVVAPVAYAYGKQCCRTAMKGNYQPPAKEVDGTTPTSSPWFS